MRGKLTDPLFLNLGQGDTKIHDFREKMALTRFMMSLLLDRGQSRGREVSRPAGPYK